jgi:hypothetical protein
VSGLSYKKFIRFHNCGRCHGCNVAKSIDANGYSNISAGLGFCYTCISKFYGKPPPKPNGVARVPLKSERLRFDR